MPLALLRPRYKRFDVKPKAVSNLKNDFFLRTFPMPLVSLGSCGETIVFSSNTWNVTKFWDAFGKYFDIIETLNNTAFPSSPKLAAFQRRKVIPKPICQKCVKYKTLSLSEKPRRKTILVSSFSARSKKDLGIQRWRLHVETLSGQFVCQKHISTGGLRNPTCYSSRSSFVRLQSSGIWRINKRGSVCGLDEFKQSELNISVLRVVLTSQTDMLLPFEDLETPPTQNQGCALISSQKHSQFPKGPCF